MANRKGQPPRVFDVGAFYGEARRDDRTPVAGLGQVPRRVLPPDPASPPTRPSSIFVEMEERRLVLGPLFVRSYEFRFS